MSDSEMPKPARPQSSAKRILKIAVQVVVMVAIFAALFWYIGVDSLYTALLNIKVEYLALAFLMYFGINIFFTIRLRRVLAKGGVKTTFGKTLLAQFAGMLTSDVTPGRSGYILTPVYLKDQNVPSSKALSSILGIQTVEFLVKVLGGIGAAIFLLQTVPASNWPSATILGVNVTFFVIGLGIALMLTGALLLAAVSWSKRAISIFDRIANSRYLKRFTGGIMGKLEDYKDSGQKTRSAIPEIFLLTMVCWVLKGFEWYFLGLALGITQIPFIGYFLIHPLVTALAFVPITPAGAGVQEFGIVGIFALLGVADGPAGAFAIVARGMLIIEDLIGVPQVVKSTSLIFSRKKPQATPPMPSTTA
ncbi:MAG: flippase-like domain-containing protein [Candidatus Bathyarchaeota archaeon]|nr:flippase-like domain-containing protein [Candidatus Bathyarchaeota archaeon]